MVAAKRLAAVLLAVAIPCVVHGEAVSPPPIPPEGAVDQSGNRHELAGSGYTVLDFAAAWCEPCYQALPRLEALARKHPRIRFLVVSVDEEVEGRDRLVEDLGLRLPVIWDDGHALVERFRPRGFPATYVLDSQGEIVYQHVGYSKKKWRELEGFLSRLGGPE